ncbi:uncharacterized protein BDV17DRAFT_137905 [Aspergillus undulatus]|uniref:uncharacterized protein n=1 Tax=Aspergillus undulatus TaxID=1810928 RepID=UPI003CCE149B
MYHMHHDTYMPDFYPISATLLVCRTCTFPRDLRFACIFLCCIKGFSEIYHCYFIFVTTVRTWVRILRIDGYHRMDYLYTHMGSTP